MRIVGTSTPGQRLKAEQIVPLFTGAVLAVGTFPSMWPVVDGIFALLCVTAWFAGVRPPKWALILAIPIGLSAIWSPVPIDGVTAAIRIVAIAFAGRSILNGDRSDGVWISLGFIAGLAIQTLALASVGWLHDRPAGLSLNAYILGEAGLAVFMLTAWRYKSYKWAALATATIYIVLSSTRSTAIGLLAYAIATRNIKIAAAGITISALFIAWAFSFGGTAGRLSSEALEESAEQRVGTFQGDDFARQQVESAFGTDVPEQDRSLRLFGYGWGGYLPSTGLTRPHNVAAMLVWELGILALIPVGVLLWAIWRRWIAIPVLIGWMVVWMVSDDLASRPEVQYMFAAVILFGILHRRSILRGTTDVG